jgi:hypothetical protein
MRHTSSMSSVSSHQPRVVEHHVAAPVLFQRQVDQALGHGGVRDVPGQPHRARQALLQLGDALGPPPEQHQAHPGAVQRLGRGQPDAGGGARDQGRAVAKVHGAPCLLRCRSGRGGSPARCGDGPFKRGDPGNGKGEALIQPQRAQRA